MKTSEIREMSQQDLLERLENETNQLQHMKIDHTVTPLNNPSQIKALRRNIARMKTELRQREINK